MMKLRGASPRVFLLAFAGLLFSAGTWGDTSINLPQSSRRTTPDSTIRTYSIRGSVRSALNDVALEMVRVDLVRFTGETIGTSFSRNNGEFEFTGITGGEYFLDVKLEGYEPLREKVEIFNASRIGVYLFLRPVNTVKVAAKDPAISARELAIPKKAADAYNKGMEQLVLKSAPEASLRHFDKALDAHPAYYEAHHMRGVAYFQLGRLAEAEKDFRASLEKSNGKYAEPYFGLAALDTIGQRFLHAVELATQGLSVDGESWRGYFELARAKAGLGQYEEAAKAIDQARQRKLDFPDIYLISANINLRRQNGPALLADLDQFLKLQPNGPQADQARKMRDAVRNRMATAQPQPDTPPPAKKP